MKNCKHKSLIFPSPHFAAKLFLQEMQSRGISVYDQKKLSNLVTSGLMREAYRHKVVRGGNSRDG